MANRHLTKISGTLISGEEIVASVTGSLDEDHTVRGVIAMTTKRVVFAGAGRIMNSINRSTAIQQVTAINLNKGMMYATLTITHAGGTDSYRVKYREAESFATSAQTAVATAQTA